MNPGLKTTAVQARRIPLFPGPALFLSPHYDDVVLSCGGTVARMVDAGEDPLIVTLFGGEVTDDVVSEFALWKHSRWGAQSVGHILGVRQGEDADAARALGCRALSLGFPDAIYRGERYQSDPMLFGQPQEFELRLVDFMVEEVLSLPDWQEGMHVFVPMGIGNHVDHQLTFSAGQALARLGTPVYAYEDCPYSIHTPEGLTRRLEALRPLLGEPVLVNIDDTVDRRIEAIAAYRTQVPVIFRFTDDMPGSVREFTRRAGESVDHCERFWPLRPGS